MALFGAFLVPTKTLILAHPKVKALMARYYKREHTSDYEKTLEAAAESQDLNIKIATSLLTAQIFGAAVPPLMLFAPVAAWLQLCSLEFVQTQGDEEFGHTLAQVPAHSWFDLHSQGCASAEHPGADACAHVTAYDSLWRMGFVGLALHRFRV